MQTIQNPSCKQLLKFFALTSFLIIHAKQPVDYNGNPIRNSGTVTITPKTSPAILASYVQSINYDGMIDNTFFFNGGTAVTGTARAVVLQSDGKIIAGGATDITHFQLARYNINGSTDTSFNFSIDTTFFGNIYAVVLQLDGKIVGVGNKNVFPNNYFQISRYNTNGSVDPSFNFVTPVAISIAYAAVLQPDGKIIAAGENFAAGHVFQLTRYDTNGSVDPSFNFNTATAPAGQANAVLLQPDGKVVAVGSTATPTFQLARYNPNGSIDTSFTFNPATATAGYANAAVLQPDGKIVVVGENTGENKFQLTRYNADGSIDTSFIFNTTTAIAGRAQAAALQSDGKIIAVGVNLTGGETFQVTRYNTDGSIDTAFTTTPTPAGWAYATVLQPDGKIIATGNNNNTNKFQVARYINPFTLASFTAAYGEVGLV